MNQFPQQQPGLELNAQGHAARHPPGGLDSLDWYMIFSYFGFDAPAVFSPVRGDIITAQGSPAKWTRYGWTAPAANVRKVFGGDNGEIDPTYKNALDGTLPVIVTPAGAGASGTSLIFSHRDHNHPATDVASKTLLDSTLATLNVVIALSYAVALSPSQQLTSNSVTFQNVTGMSLPLTANQVWRFAMTLIFISSVAADFQFQFTVPAGATLFFSTGPVVVGGGTVEYASVGAATPAIADGTAANVAIEIMGTVICGATAGNLQLQAAQNVATVEATDFVVAGSNIFGRRMN